MNAIAWLALIWLFVCCVSLARSCALNGAIKTFKFLWVGDSKDCDICSFKQLAENLEKEKKDKLSVEVKSKLEKLVQDCEPLQPEIAELVNKHFWDLI